MEVILVSLLVYSFLYYAKASSACAPGYFRCLNGRCIELRNVCDTYNDCEDNSDETVCIPYNCPGGTFQCNNGNCISSLLVCSSTNHCEDNSHESACEPYKCHPSAFPCSNGICIAHYLFCYGGKDCGDNSDERYCNISSSVECPPSWIRCPSGSRCIPSAWVCDGWDDCNSYLKTPGISEEASCGNNRTSTTSRPAVTLPSSTTVTTVSSTIKTTSSTTLKIRSGKNTIAPSSITLSLPQSTFLKTEQKSWSFKRKSPGSGTDRWGSQVPRISVALHLSDNSTFSPGNSTGDEIRYELTTQLLNRLQKDKSISSQELALYVHALLVSCLDPRDFYGEDLVQRLRQRVESSEKNINPIVILALCNAGNAMTDRDVERVTTFYDSQKRPFWTDYRALSSMALSCISSSGVSVKRRTLSGMLQELKSRQFKNGTVDNFRTTAIVTQALFIYDSYKTDFDLDSAMKVLNDGINEKSSLLDVYYALPALNGKSLLNVTSAHCNKQPATEKEEGPEKELDVTGGETMPVLFSIWMGDDKSFGRTWHLKMSVQSTLYKAIETASKIYTLNVKYYVVDGKPYVSSLNGKEDDPELGLAWFVFLGNLSSEKERKIVEESPVDIKLQPNQEIILWYKRGPWSDNEMKNS